MPPSINQGFPYLGEGGGFFTLDAQVMLILILIDVQCSQKAVFSFENDSNRQNHASSGSLHLVKKSPLPSKISDSPHPLPLFGKPC